MVLSLWEADLLLWIQEHCRAEVLNPIWEGITHLGDAGIFWIFIALLLTALPKTRKTGHIALFSIIIGFLSCNILLKNLAARIRPYDLTDKLIILITKPTDYSFPSGHTMVSFACGLVIYRFLPKKFGIPALILATLVAFSRLYFGVHYPTDILGGFIVAYLAGLLAAWLEKKLSEHTKDKKEKVEA